MGKLEDIYHYEVDIDLDKEWSVISQKLHKKKKRFLPYFITGSLLMAGILVGSYFLMASHTITPLSKSDIARAIVSNTNTEQSTPMQAEEQLIQYDPNYQLESNNTVNDLSSKVRSASPMDKENRSIAVSQKELIREENPLPMSNDMSSVSLGSHDNHLLFEDQLTNDSGIITPQPLKLSTTLKGLEIISIMPKMKSETPSVECDIALNIFEKHRIKKEKISSFFFRGYVGLANRTLSGGENTLTTKLRQQYEKPLEVVGSELGWTMRHPSNVNLYIGLGYESITERFAMNDQVEYTESYLGSSLYTTDGQSQVIDEYYTRSRSYEVDALQYNHLKTWYIPIRFEYDFSINKQSAFKINTGIRVPVSFQYSGTIFNNDVTVEEINPSNVEQNKLVPSLEHGFAYKYSIRKAHDLHIGANAAYDINNRFDVGGVGQRYATYLLTIGYTYSML